jgi:hypothetical protein
MTPDETAGAYPDGPAEFKTWLLEQRTTVNPPLGVGQPSITEAPEVRVAFNPTSGNVSVWVASVGYLNDVERRAFAAFTGGDHVGSF